MSVDVLSVTLRALGFLTLFQAAGIVLFLAFREQELPNTERSLRRIGILAALIAAAFLIAQYFLESGRMSGELGGMLDPTLQAIVMRSAVSVTLSWRLLGLLLIVGGLRRGGTGGGIAGVIGVVLLLASFTLVGHTSKDTLRWLLSPVLLAHLSVVAFWYGSLLPLYLVSAHGLAGAGTAARGPHPRNGAAAEPGSIAPPLRGAAHRKSGWVLRAHAVG